MTIKEFVDRFYLHDSGVQEIKKIKDDKIIEMYVDFCYWMQDDYQDGDKENGNVKFVFYDVELFEIHYFDIEDHSFDDDCILECCIEKDNTLLFKMMKDIIGKYYEIRIAAGSVEVVDAD